MSLTSSEYTPQQQHDIIMSTLSEFGKGPECFKTRWNPDDGEYLTGDILLQTPIFYFMKYKFSRQEIETLFFKAHVVINDLFDIGLRQTFGGNPGPRWKGGGGFQRDTDTSQQTKEDDTMHYHINHPTFEYHPVVQPVDWQMTGGVNNKGKEQTNTEKHESNKYKQYGNMRKVSDDEEPVPKDAKLNDFIDDICGEIEPEDRKDPDNAYGSDDEDFVAINPGLNKDGKAARSIKTTVTRGKIQHTKDNHKLKRMAGGMNISNKSIETQLMKKSNSLRHEKAKLIAIGDAKKDVTNVTKHEF